MLERVLTTIISCIIAYLISAISPSIIISNKFYKKDVRDFYSKNAGATNASRVMGIKIGFFILVCDGLKIGLALAIIKLLTLIQNDDIDLSSNSVYITSIFAILGHCFPIYYKFKGGKGVGPFLGFALFLNPIYFVIVVASWWIIFLLIRIVSLASLLSIIITFLTSWIFKINELSINMWMNHKELYFDYLLGSYWTQLVMGCCALIVIIRHYENIIRLIKGKEKKFITTKLSTNTRISDDNIK